MPDVPQTPDASGSAAGGDKGQTSTADANARAGAAPASAPNSNDAFFEQLSGRISQAITPLVERLGKLENYVNGGARVKGKRTGDASSQAATGDDGDGNSDASQDEVRKLTGELEVLKTKELERARAEQASRLSTEVDRAIEAGGYARSEIIKDLMLPHLRIGQTGTVLYDRDGKVLSIEDALRHRFGKDPAFLKPSATNGTGLTGSERAPVQVDGKKMTADDIKAIPPGTPEFRNLKAQMRKRNRNK